MSRLVEQIDVDAPIQTTWDGLHRVEAYPRFLEGVREARPEGETRASLSTDMGGRTKEIQAEITDRDQEHLMRWKTTSGPDMSGSFSLLPIDQEHTRVQARVEYDPGTVKDTFGGPKGFAQVQAMERLVRTDLEHFKQLVEEKR